MSSWSSSSGKRDEIAGFRRPAVRVDGARRHSTARGGSTFAVRIRVHSPKAIVARVAVSTRPVCALLAVAATSHFCGFLLTMEQTSSSSSSSSRSMSIAVRGHSIDSILGVHGHFDVREKDRLTEKERERERERTREREANTTRGRARHESFLSPDSPFRSTTATFHASGTRTNVKSRGRKSSVAPRRLRAQDGDRQSIRTRHTNDIFFN